MTTRPTGMRAHSHGLLEAKRGAFRDGGPNSDDIVGFLFVGCLWCLVMMLFTLKDPSVVLKMIGEAMSNTGKPTKQSSTQLQRGYIASSCSFVVVMVLVRSGYISVSGGSRHRGN